MIRVLHILWSAHFGGIERLVLDLVSAQSNHTQIEVGVLFGTTKGEFLGKFRAAGMNCHFLGLNSGHDISMRKYFNAVRIFQQYDILHVHSASPLLIACATISSKTIISTLHSGFGFGRKKTWHDPMKSIFVRWFLNYRVDYISFNSQYTKKVAESRYGLNGVRKSVVYNGIDFKEHFISTTGIENSLLQELRGKFVVGTVSRFKRVKRIDRLVEAFADFQRSKDTILLLVGDGPLRDELKRLVGQLKLDRKSIFTGFTHNVREFQSLMDVNVFPSESETFGLVAVEALSLGKPTIVFGDGGGIAEVVGHFSQDDVVHDIRHLVNRLEYYYDNRSELVRLAQDRIQYAHNFNIDNTAARFSAIYKELI